MANTDNLRPFNKMSKEEHLELSRRGAQKTAERNRRRKTMRQMMKLLLEADAPEKWRQMLEELGVGPDYMDNQAAVLAGLLGAAVGGDVRAVREIRSILGQTIETPLETRERKARIARLEAEAERCRQGGDAEQDTGVLILPEVLPGQADGDGREA